MRMNIDLDDKLVSEAFKYSGVKTKKELITLTLKEFVESRKRRNIADIRGKINFIEGYDYKEMRKISK